MRQRIFIGSSSEGLEIANAVSDNLTEDHEPTVWNQDAFAPSQGIFSNLVVSLDKYDAAIFILSPDDATQMRGATLLTARDNVVFELGLFIGRLGPERTFFIVPKDEKDLHLPTDLLGIVALTYIKRSDGNWTAALAPACNEIRPILAKNGQRSQSNPTQSILLYPEAVAWLHDYVNKALSVFLTTDSNRLPVDRVKVGESELRSTMGRVKICVRFGRIEDCDAIGEGHVVALPANEFFDDECIEDTRSALGAYIKHSFSGRIGELQAEIRRALAGENTELVESEPNQSRPSYGIGKCVYLAGPVLSGHKVLLVSVTTKRADAGLRCEARYLTELHLPIVGSGHGGLEPELALLYCLLAIRAALDARLAIHLKSACIVVFQKDQSSEPLIPKEHVRRILSVATTTL